jgi:hypothetical protein
MVSVAALRRRGQSGDGACGEITQQAFDREGWDVMALVDDDVAVAREVEAFAAGQRLDHRDVDAAGARGLGWRSDLIGRDLQELGQPADPLLKQRATVHEHER